MAHLNERILTNKERDFIIASKIERSKAKFKNPAVMRERLRKKAKNILSEIPEIIEDIDMLSKFSVEEKLGGHFGEVKSSCNLIIIIYQLICQKFPSNEIELDKWIEFEKSTDTKKILLLSVSALFLFSDEEYKNTVEKMRLSLQNMNEYVTSHNQAMAKKIDIEKAKKLYEVFNSMKPLPENLLNAPLDSMIPIFTVIDSISSKKEKTVAIEIFKKGMNGINRSTIPRNTGIDIRSVTKCIKALIDKDFIEIIPKKDKNGKRIETIFWKK